MRSKKEVRVRWLFFACGVFVLSFGISMTIKAEQLGIGPWDVFHYGLWLQLGLTIGTWAIITGFFVLGLATIMQKSWPKIGSFLNMLFIGIFIDLFNLLLKAPESILGSISFLLIGTVAIGIGIGLYVGSEIGAGPRDSLMLVLMKRTGWKVQRIRSIIELTVLGLGWILGGPVGFGTLFLALSIGPIVSITLPKSQKMIEYLLRGEHNENLNKGKVRIDNYDRISKETR